MKQTTNLNPEVTGFLAALNHPLIQEIELLRRHILTARPQLAENIKWNGPNYSLNGNDRITMKIHPPAKIQLIFHRGAKVLALPAGRLIDDSSGLLLWKTADRAVASFKTIEEISSRQHDLAKIITDWLDAASVPS